MLNVVHGGDVNFVETTKEVLCGPQKLYRSTFGRGFGCPNPSARMSITGCNIPNKENKYSFEYLLRYTRSCFLNYLKSFKCNLNFKYILIMAAHIPTISSSLSASTQDIEKQEAQGDIAEVKIESKSGPHGHGGGRDLPPNHPMHPSQFSGDRFERTPLLTLLGCFCVMVRSPESRLD
jgi:hypothetical protein